MFVEFERPWLLLAAVAAAAVVVLPLLRRKWDFRLRLNVAVRLAVSLLLTLALSGMAAVLPGGEQALMMAADRSDSMDAHAAGVTRFVDDVERMKGGVRTGLIAFGGDARVEYLEGTGSFTGFDTAVRGAGTDIGGALNLALGLLPQDAARRVLLLSDGLENGGDALSAARALAAAGIRMDVAYFPPARAGEAQATSLEVPGTLYAGERFEAVVTAHATNAGPATLRLYRDRAQVAEQAVELQKGENRFVFSFTAEDEGIHAWTADVSAAWDTLPANNRADAFTRVAGRAAVLLVSDAPEETEELGKILESAGYIVDRKGAVELGGQLDEAMRYQAVVLCNVPAPSLSEDATAMLDAYVRVLGRGLLVTGGQDAFALGEYGGTKLEELLPVKSEIENYAELPKLALALVIDKSGSMGMGEYGISKRDLAVEAAVRSVEILQPTDEIGVIAFDGEGSWVVPMGAAEDKKAIQDRIATIRIGGGTMMYTPMSMALETLRASDAKRKHVILLTDGQPGDSGFEELAGQMSDAGITLSTVAVGKDADSALLTRLAELANGRCHVVDEFSNIVSVFTKETYLATGAYLQNRTFTPAATSLAPEALSSGLPPLHGYVNTTPKQTAEVQLVSDRGHTVYARWRCGLGRAAVWTSDVKGLWSGDLLASPGAVGIVSSLVAQVLPEDDGGGALEAELAGGEAVVRLQGETGQGASASATVIAPDNTSFELELAPVRPGEYEARFNADMPGTYVVRATAKQPGLPDATVETGLSAGWSREYDLWWDDPEPRLREAAALTGGTFVTSAAELFAQNMALKRGRTDLSGPLLLLALFLFLLDVAARRLRWDARLPGWLAARKARARTVRATEPAGTPQKAETGAVAGEGSKVEDPVRENGAGSSPAKKPQTAEKGAEGPNAMQALLEKRRQQKRQ